MRLCYGNLACPEWTFENPVEAVRTYGLDGLEIRLFDGDVVTAEPQCLSAPAGRTRSSPRGVKVAALDTSLTVTSPDRERFLADVYAMAEIAEQWGAPCCAFSGAGCPGAGSGTTGWAGGRALGGRPGGLRPRRGAGGGDARRLPAPTPWPACWAMPGAPPGPSRRPPPPPHGRAARQVVQALGR